MARLNVRRVHIFSGTLDLMGEPKNLTLHLPVDLIRRTKVYAAQHDTSINSVVRDLLEQLVSSEDQYRTAADRLLELADQGPYTNVDPASIRREDIY
jgi:plasmid stability protein